MENWLPTVQRFDVAFDVEDEETTFFRGLDRLDVPGGSTATYALRVMALDVGARSGTVRFTAPATGEYAEYVVQAQVAECAVLETVKLEAAAMSLASTTIYVANPRRAAVAVGEVTCDSEYVSCVQVGDMSGMAEGAFAVSYRPLAPGGGAMEEAELVIRTDAIGDFRYKLKLAALPALGQSEVRVRGSLGARTEQTVGVAVFQIGRASCRERV